MSAGTAVRLVPRRAPLPLEQRGRIYYPEDIVTLYRGRRSRDWIIRHFAPEFRQKDGKLVFWWQCDVERYFGELVTP